MKFDLILSRFSKRLPIICGTLLASYLGMQGLIRLLTLIGFILRKHLLTFEEQFLLAPLLYLVLLLVFASFIIKNKVSLKIAITQIDELPFFSQPILMLFVASGLLGMVMFMTLMLLL
mgnify:CR=1 FL=1